MKLQQTTLRNGTSSGYTLAEVSIAILVVGTITVALFGAFSGGLNLVKLARENLRATQILSQKMETLRLMTWSQLTNTSIVATNFTDWYNPDGTNSNTAGAKYRGIVAITSPATNIPSDYRTDMKLVTVSLYWTNTVANSTNLILRSRQVQTYAARYGMQNYVYQ
jgi:type II secretory pathway pseudopilin PulG